MSGLDVAAATAQLLGVAGAIASKLVPFLADTKYTDQSIRTLRQDLEDFRTVIRRVEKTFGLRRKYPLGSESLRKLHEHLRNGRGLLEELRGELPDVPPEDRTLAAQFVTQMKQLVRSKRISRMCSSVTEMKLALQLWIEIVAAEEVRGSKQQQQKDQAMVDQRLGHLTAAVHSLHELLLAQTDDPGVSAAESNVRRNAKECLAQAESVHRALSTAGSTRSSMHTELISAWDDEMLPHGFHSRESASRAELTPDSTSWSEQTLGEDECLTEKVYGDLIDDCVRDVRRFRGRNDLDSAAAAQYDAISYSLKRKRHHGSEFHNERDMKMTLADLHIARQYYSSACEILEELLEGEKPDSTEALALNCSLARAYLRDNNLDRALHHANEAYKGRLRDLEKGNPLIIATVHLLQQIWDAKGQPREARIYAGEALQHRILQNDASDAEVEKLVAENEDPRAILRFLSALDADAHDIEAVALKSFHHAVALNNLAVAKQLFASIPAVRKHPDLPNALGTRPLMSATEWGHTEMVAWLLATTECDVNARASHDLSDNTALMIAAGRQSAQLVSLLLAHHASASDHNRYGRTALHHAVSVPARDAAAIAAQVAVVRALLDAGGPVLLRKKCKASKTPLHEAAEAGNAAIVVLFAQEGAALEARDVGGRTPLLAAIDAGKPEVVAVLLAAGADWDARDEFGRTTFKAARQPVGGSQKMLKMLKKRKKEAQVGGNAKLDPACDPTGRGTGPGTASRIGTPDGIDNGAKEAVSPSASGSTRRSSTQSAASSPLAAPAPAWKVSIFAGREEDAVARGMAAGSIGAGLGLRLRAGSAAGIGMETSTRVRAMSVRSTATAWGAGVGRLLSGVRGSNG